MRKRIVQDRVTDGPAALAEAHLPIESIAQVEVTSEDPGAPIEAVFSHSAGSGWRAGSPGQQRVTILFDEPERVRRITLKFVESDRPRTQEFVLTWSPRVGSPAHIIVRQQWTFSPSGSTTEFETYDVNLDQVVVLELMIVPDLNDHLSVATLAEWRIFGEQ